MATIHQFGNSPSILGSLVHRHHVSLQTVPVPIFQVTLQTRPCVVVKHPIVHSKEAKTPPTQHPLCDIDPRPHTMREIASHSAGASKHQASKQATSAPRRRPQPRCDSAAAAPSRSLGTSCRAAEMGSRDAIIGDLCIAVGTDPGADRCITIVMHGGIDRASFRFLGLRRVLLRVPTHCTSYLWPSRNRAPTQTRTQPASCLSTHPPCLRP